MLPQQLNEGLGFSSDYFIVPMASGYVRKIETIRTWGNYSEETERLYIQRHLNDWLAEYPDYEFVDVKQITKAQAQFIEFYTGKKPESDYLVLLKRL